MKLPEPIKLEFKPGVNREGTNYGGTGGWYDGNLVRFRGGKPESMGGWKRFTGPPVQGTFRSLFAWAILSGGRFYAAGTNLKYYIVAGNSAIDITPIRATATLAANPFSVTNTGTSVTVTHTAHGAVANDFVTYSGATGPIGGVPAADFNKEHQIVSIVGTNSYTIIVSTSATSTATGGGAVVSAEYQINVGLDTSVAGAGWGTSTWGSGGWGESSSSFVVTNYLRLWSEDNFGEDLLFNARDGGLYFKNMTGLVSTRAVSLSSLSTTGNIPTIARQIMVSDSDRHILAFATDDISTGVQDVLLIRWSDAEDKTDWTPLTSNSAGSTRINGGSEFVRAVETTLETLVFTDTTLHSLRFIGPPYTFGINRIGENILLAGPNAVVSTGSETFWMSKGLFQMYDGVVRDLPCYIREYVFSILNKGQSEKIYAGVNRQYNEVIWLMPVNGSEENNFYVVCNYENPGNLQWYYGDFNTAGRTTWLDAGFEDFPMAGAPDGYLYTHDNGDTDVSSGADVILDSRIKSSVFEIGAGNNFMLVSRTIPDLDFTGSTSTTPGVTFSFYKRDYPGSAFETSVDETVTRTVDLPIEEYTEKVDKRFRARSVQVEVKSTTVGTKWRLGVPRVYASPDGQR